MSVEKDVLTLNKSIQKYEKKINKLENQNSILQNDSIQNGKAYDALQDKYNELEITYESLASKNTKYIETKAKETKKLLEKLEKAKLELFLKEDELKKLSDSLSQQKNDLEVIRLELDNRAKRVTELEAIISSKDSMATVLKKNLSKALVGLEGEGLTIEKKNGKLYLSLEEELLFASGKYELNSIGIDALNKLANVLASQKELEILVEGHTDSIPYNRGQLKDNWDLSVMRATSVVKELMKNDNLRPIQFTAAGRGEFVPIEPNSTLEGRAANRRIEMILSPRLDNILELLEN